MKYTLLAICAVLVVLAASVSTYKFVAAQTDEDLIASIGGMELKRQQVRQAIAYQILTSDGSTAGKEFLSKIKEIAITTLVDDMIEYSEAIKRGYTVTDAEVENFIAPFRQACAGPQGEDCRKVIRLLGMTFDGFWDESFDNYRRFMTRMKLKSAHVDSLYSDGWTADERNEAMGAFEEQLRADAEVEWADDEMREIYEGAGSRSARTVFD